MEVQKKIQQARKLLKEMPTKKEGKNTFSKYDYFTPSQISDMVFLVEQELNLFHKFDLVKNDDHVLGQLSIYNLDKDEAILFEMLTDIPSIKATNSTQQLGGAMTYTKRYMLMNAYDIQDNNLDFDTDKKATKTETKKEEPKLPWLNTGTKEWSNTVEKLSNGTITIEEVRKYYTINKVNAKTLTELTTK